MTIKAEFPEKLDCLFQPARYKILYGGRGGAKSWGAARALLIQGATRPLRVLCAREYQNSIKDSVHKLLADQIDALGLSDAYEVLEKEIRGRNGTEFAFRGLHHNVTALKSFESADVCWVEEAQTVSKSSWNTLIPTIRKPGSEIWITFNPELDTDETYKRFVLNPPPDSIVRKINWNDNPFFPDVLRAEKDHLKATDPDSYLVTWEGHCRQTLDGAIYAKEIRDATADGRITKVPYDRSKPVSTFWDLGWSDMTSIWFSQIIGFEFRVIDFLQDRQKTIQGYLRDMQALGYVYHEHWLPHDAASQQLAAGGRSIESQMREAGHRVRIVPNIKIAQGINAVRTIFPNCWFDEAKCADGLNALRRYRYDVDQETGQFSRQPLHDENSHAADALRMMAVAFREEKQTKLDITPPQRPSFRGGRMGGSWMA